jgi:hypothetical protein
VTLVFLVEHVLDSALLAQFLKETASLKSMLLHVSIAVLVQADVLLEQLQKNKMQMCSI